jgi:hypothetical protein
MPHITSTQNTLRLEVQHKLQTETTRNPEQQTTARHMSVNDAGEKCHNVENTKRTRESSTLKCVLWS